MVFPRSGPKRNPLVNPRALLQQRTSFSQVRRPYLQKSVRVVPLVSRQVSGRSRGIGPRVRDTPLLDSIVGRSPRVRDTPLLDSIVGRSRPLPRATARSSFLRPRPLTSDIPRGSRLRLRRKALPAAEATLREQPLRCAGSDGPIADSQGRSLGWHQVLNDEHRRSFVSYRKDAFTASTLRQWFRALHEKIKWDQPRVGARLLPRSAAWLTEGQCTCCYRYGGTSWKALPMEKWFLEITDAVCHACGISERPNSCNANLYKDGSEMVGWHSDDEPLFDATSHDTLILSLSLGEEREFAVRPNDDPAETTYLRLGDGDICTMEGLLQKHYKHAVPKQRSAGRPRINLTWRWVVAHDAGCPLRREKLPAPNRVGNVKSEVFTTPPNEKADAIAEPHVRIGVKRNLRAHTAAPAAEARDAPAASPKVSEEEQAKRQARAQRFRQSPAGAPVEFAPSSKPALPERSRLASAALQLVSKGQDDLQKKGTTRESQKDIDAEKKRLRDRRNRRGSRSRDQSRSRGRQKCIGEGDRRDHRCSRSRDRSRSRGRHHGGHSSNEAKLTEAELRRKRGERFASPAPGPKATIVTPSLGSIQVKKDDGGGDANSGRASNNAEPSKEEMKRRRAERFGLPAPGSNVDQKPSAASKSVKKEDQSSDGHAGADSSALAGSSPGLAQLVAQKSLSEMSEKEKREWRKKRFG